MPYKDKKDQAAYRRRHYIANKQKYVDKAKRYNKASRAYWQEYKKGLKCKRCGKNPHFAAMQFHHRDPSTKVENVAIMIRKTYGKQRILGEMAKCDVLCANCHAIVDYEYKSKQGNQ